MNTPFKRGIAKATDLTNAGKLQEATALIQTLLGKARPNPEMPDTSDVIDGEFTRLDEAAPEKTGNARGRPTADRAGMPRSRLRETLRRIAAGGMPDPTPLTRPSVEVPAGAEFLSLTHASPHGTRDYRLYVPATRPADRMPLVVMLHGCTQSPEDFAKGTGMNQVAEDLGVLVAYPAQPSGANAQKCWNWFRPEDQVRGKGEPALIAGLVREILTKQSADPDRVYIAGLSAGGAAAATVAAAYPDLFTAVGVHSGLPAGAAQDIPSAFAAMRSGAPGAVPRSAVPTIVFHGLADSTVHPQNGTAVIQQARHGYSDLLGKTESGHSEGGRRYRRTRYGHPDGNILAEHWEIDGAGHAWAGGHPSGSYTDPKGPDASREMLRFFLTHKKR